MPDNMQDKPSKDNLKFKKSEAIGMIAVSWALPLAVLLSLIADIITGDRGLAIIIFEGVIFILFLVVVIGFTRTLLHHQKR